jgi:hypothetical protein
VKEAAEGGAEFVSEASHEGNTRGVRESGREFGGRVGRNGGGAGVLFSGT